LARPIVEAIQLKLREQIERTEHLIQLVPSDQLGWDPRLPQGSTDVGHLLGHLLDCIAGFCAVFHAAFPQQLGDFSRLQSLPVNHFCGPEEALSHIRDYAAYITHGFGLCRDSDLPRRVPSAFVPQGESLATLNRTLAIKHPVPTDNHDRSNPSPNIGAHLDRRHMECVLRFPLRIVPQSGFLLPR
jgi:hypothetical protein